MNTFLPANMLTNKDKVISLRDDTVKVSDENADRTMIKPPAASYSARVKVHIKPLGIKFVEKIDSSACPTIRDFVERQLWKVQEIRGKEIRLYVEEEENEEEGYELFGDTETCVLKPDELLTVKLVSDDTKKPLKKAKTVERTRKTTKVTSTTRMVDFYEEENKKRKKGEEENAEKDSSSEDEDGENESILKHQIVHSAIVRAGAKGIHAKDLSVREKVKLNTVRAVQLKGMQKGIYKRVSPGTYAITSKGSEKVIKKMKNSPLVLTISTPTNAKIFTIIKSPLTTRRKLLTTDDISSRLTGKMISVKFEDPPEWFVATVLSFDVIEQKSSLFYQDGDRELLNMAKACRKGQLSWVVHGDNGTPKTPGSARYRLPPPSSITDSEKAQRALEGLRRYIKSFNGTLPEGWNDVDIHYYRNGNSENYFISPDGKKYKGPRAVARALNLL